MDNFFDWMRLGDVKMGREHLGSDMPVVVYRLLQYTMMDVLTEKLGYKSAENIFREAGYRAGLAFGKNVLRKNSDYAEFLEDFQTNLKKLKIGILRVERADYEKKDFIITVSEDLDCSGLPVTGETVCAYDEGFIAGVFEVQTGDSFDIKEIDCWATGDRTCRFSVKAVGKD